MEGGWPHCWQWLAQASRVCVTLKRLLFHYNTHLPQCVAKQAELKLSIKEMVKYHQNLFARFPLQNQNS